MHWPWKLETREESRDEIVAAILNQSPGGTDAATDAVAALETAAGAVSRAFAVAEVLEAGPWAEALSAGFWRDVGRGLVRAGEVLYRIDIDEGPRLWRASDYDLSGSADSTTWRYKLQESGPSRSRTVRASAAEVLHFVYGTDTAEPWRGRSPLHFANLSARLLAEAEALAADLVSGPRGQLLPVPAEPQGETDTQLDDLKGDIRGLRGSTALVETQRAGWGDPNLAARGNADWQPRQLAGAPDPAVVSLQSEAAVAVMGACGIPPGLFSASGDGTKARESYRQFLHMCIEPLADLVVEELRQKLDRPGLGVSFQRLFAGDLAGRARAFQSLVGGGMKVEKAAGLAGLDQ